MKNIDIIYNNALFSRDDVFSVSDDILPYVSYLHDSISFGSRKQNFLYEKNESSINLPFDSGLLEIINNFVSKIDVDKLKYVFVVGIGGSNLGTKAVYDGLRGSLDYHSGGNVPKIIFLDTVDGRFLDNLHTILKREIKSKEEILVNIISKSGDTTETVTNFEILNSFLEDLVGDIKDSVVVTTGRGSKLWDLAEEKKLKILEIPNKVGGRYSVFSAVGLFPLAVCGFDVDSLLLGAKNMRDICIVDDIEKNPALISAILIYLYNKKDIKIHNTFFFNPELESMGKWYRQLMGESLGKKFDTNGNEVKSGITPIVSIGSTDLHSMAQLYFGGPMDKFTTFVYAQDDNRKISLPDSLSLGGLVEGIEGKDVFFMMKSILSGVKIAYKKNKLPYMEMRLNNINEYSLGQFLQFKMIEMMYIAHLIGIDAFDQPNVEDYKNETRSILLEQ